MHPAGVVDNSLYPSDLHLILVALSPDPWRLLHRNACAGTTEGDRDKERKRENPNTCKVHPVMRQDLRQFSHEQPPQVV